MQAIANDLGISIYELMGVPKPEARQRKPAADGTRSPARAKYLLPNGEMWSGKGKIPHAIRAQLDGAEGYNPDGASFESKEARTNALKKFLIDQSDA